MDVSKLLSSGIPARLVADVLRPSAEAQTQPKPTETASPEKAQAGGSVQAGPRTMASQLAQALVDTNDAYKRAGVAVAFSVDQDSGSTVVKVQDTSTGEVLRQIPPSEMLALASAVKRIDTLIDSYTQSGASGTALDTTA